MKCADVIVVGGGAAGLICAGTSARRGKKVIVLEKMSRPARKILVTGKGRCNLTNNVPVDDLISAVRRNNRFLYGAFNILNAQDTMALFESLGVPLKTERGNRVFPVSERAMDVADALVRYAEYADIRHNEAEELFFDSGFVKGVRCSDGQAFQAESVVIATGGLSYPGTGSTGDGYRLAEHAGHTVTTQKPSLVPIVCKEPWCTDLMGLSLRNVTLSLYETGKKKPLYQEMGEMIFTHFGISGPLVLSASTYMQKEIELYRIAIDLKPALDTETLDGRILRDLGKYSAKDTKNAFVDLLPHTLIPVILKLADIDGRIKAHQLARDQRRSLLEAIKGMLLTPAALRPVEEAVITAGGVMVSEVDPKTMASKKVSGLYFAGEVLDVDARTGGFNLQIAFSTGYVAGMNC